MALNLIPLPPLDGGHLAGEFPRATGGMPGRRMWQDRERVRDGRKRQRQHHRPRCGGFVASGHEDPHQRITAGLCSLGDPRPEKTAIGDGELHCERTPFEPIQMLLQRERDAVAGPQSLEHAVAPQHRRIDGGNAVRRNTIDQDHGW